MMFDREGNPIELTKEQMNLIDILNQQHKNSSMTEEQEKVLRSINLEDLQNVELKTISQLLD
jgi:hypothetical protein